MKVSDLQLNKLAMDSKLGQNNKSNSSDTSFKEVFNNALHKVNNLQKEADVMAEKLATGEVDSIHQVMTAATKAKLSLDLTIEIRNKVVEAYKNIMRMQI